MIDVIAVMPRNVRLPRLRYLCSHPSPTIITSEEFGTSTEVYDAVRGLGDAKLILICGGQTVNKCWLSATMFAKRTIEMPLLTDERWNSRNWRFAKRMIQGGSIDLELEFTASGRLRAVRLIPF